MRLPAAGSRHHRLVVQPRPGVGYERAQAQRRSPLNGPAPPLSLGERTDRLVGGNPERAAAVPVYREVLSWRGESVVRSDANPEKVVLAVSKAIEARFDRSDWLSFGYETGFAEAIRDHPRLLRSLSWNDPDYGEHVLNMIESILRPPGRHHRFPDGRAIVRNDIDLDAFAVAEQMLDLPKWLSSSKPLLFKQVYHGSEADSEVDELQAAARRLGLDDVALHAARIRHGLRADPAMAIGASKELLETVLKAVLGLHGNGKETKHEIPYLVGKASVALGLDAGGVRGDEPGAEQRRKVLGSLAQLVFNTAELRNAGYGTGHGLSRGPALDVATAHLAVSAAVAAATFYIEAHAAQQV